MTAILSALTANAGWLSLSALIIAIIALGWAAKLQRKVAMVTPDMRRLVRDMEGKSFEDVLRGLKELRAAGVEVNAPCRPGGPGRARQRGGGLGRTKLRLADLHRRRVSRLRRRGIV